MDQVKEQKEKFLCQFEPCASSFIYKALGTELKKRGHDFVFWSPEQVSIHKVFSEYQPTVFYGQGYNLTPHIIRCLNQHPYVKVILKVGAWGNLNDEYEYDKYEILMANDQERENVKQLQNPHLILLNYLHPNRIPYVIGHWSKIIPRATLYGFCPCADTNDYYKVDFDENYSSDMMFCGGYWAYKGQNFHRYIFPLCHPIGRYNIKIFGNQIWPLTQYAGTIEQDELRKVISSTKVCLNVHQPDGTRYGYDITPRTFNIMASQGFIISDYLKSYEEDIFRDGEMLMAKTSEEFHKLCDHFVKHPDERLPYIEKGYETVMKYHTMSHRTNEILGLLNA
jgi:hypothetical protein